jgi:hypothetical protein
VIAWHPALWELVHTQVTADAVRSLFADRQPGQVTRHVLPQLQAMNLVLDDVLDGA